MARLGCLLDFAGDLDLLLGLGRLCSRGPLSGIRAKLRDSDGQGGHGARTPGWWQGHRRKAQGDSKSPNQLHGMESLRQDTRRCADDVTAVALGSPSLSHTNAVS